MGPNKSWNDHTSTKAHCAHCGINENVPHVYLHCQQIKQFWENLLQWWGKRTGQHVALTHRNVLLGMTQDIDDDGATLGSPELKQPFLFLRTTAYLEIQRKRYLTRECDQKEPTDLGSSYSSQA